MLKTILAAATALSLAGAAGVPAAFAQPVPPAPNGGPGFNVPPGPGSPGWGGPGWMHHRHWARMHHRNGMRETFALFYPKADRQLGPQDVQIIAQALLLWHGNHTWRVSDIAPGPDDTIQFAYTAGDNTPIARFTINVHTGHIIRVG